jgi:hypothetical protein
MAVPLGLFWQAVNNVRIKNTSSTGFPAKLPINLCGSESRLTSMKSMISVVLYLRIPRP